MSRSGDTGAEAAARKVLNNTIKTDRFWRDYSAMDLAAVVGPSVMILTLGRALTTFTPLPNVMAPAYVIAIVFLLGWGATIYVLPSWQTPLDFVKYSWDSLMTPDSYEHVEHNYDSVRGQTYEAPAKWWHTETRTQDLHWIDEFPLGADAAFRRDGYLVGAIEATSANMTLAGRDKWADNVDIFEDFLENTLDFDIAVYLPTRRFRKGEYVERHRDRLSDDDVQSNPVLEAVCADYTDWMDVKLGSSSTATRRNYVLVPVGKHEVRHLEDEETISKNLASIPLAGRAFRRLGLTGETELSEAEIRHRQIETLDRRLELVEQNCLNELSGCSAQRVTDGELAELVYAHWEGEEFEGDMGDLLRRYPVVSTDSITPQTDVGAEAKTATEAETHS